MSLPKSKRRLRAKLMESQNGACIYCGVQMTILRGPRLATFDHVIPLSEGGLDAEPNIVLACWQCNRIKGCMTSAQLRELADSIDFLAAKLSEIRDAA